jgi:hypothetical protein
MVAQEFFHVPFHHIGSAFSSDSIEVDSQPPSDNFPPRVKKQGGAKEETHWMIRLISKHDRGTFASF